MDRAWMFFMTLMALYLTAAAQEVCNRNDCNGCERSKCEERNGTCMNRTEAKSCIWPHVLKENGRSQWCTFYKTCKCCYLPCGPDCERYKCQEQNGTCMTNKEARNDCTGVVKWGGRGNWCKDYQKCKCCIPPVCNPQCVNGECTATNVCECDLCWHGPTCNDPYCESGFCQNGGTCLGPCSGCACPPGWNGFTCEEFYCEEECQNGGTCTGPNECTCAEEYYGDVCQYIVCSERTNCIGQSGTCYAKNHPILTNTTACPQTDNGRQWCTPMCACCFGA